MNVLVATFAIFPYSSGVSSYMATLSSGLTAAGCQTDVLAYTPGRRHLHLLGQGRVVDTLKMEQTMEAELGSLLRSALPGAPPEVIRRELRRYAFEGALRQLPLAGYDLVHAQDVVSAWALSRVRPADVPLVTTLHSYKAGNGPDGPQVHARLKDYLGAEERLGLESSDRLVFPSRWLGHRLASDYGLAEKPADVIPYGLDIDGFLRRAAVPPGDLKRPNQAAVLLCPARLVPEKGQTHLLAALALLRRHRQDFVCWLAGDGVQLEPLRKQARRLELGGHLVFLGERSDVASLMGSADIVVLPSLRDNLPYSIMEAQAAGKSVVASAVGGIPEMVQHGWTGLLVRPGAAGQIAAALGLLLDDPDLRCSLGQGAAQWAAAHWSHRRMLSETLSVYHQALAPGATDGRGRAVGMGPTLDPRRIAAIKQALRS